MPCGHTPTHILPPPPPHSPTDTVTVEALCLVATPQPTSYLPPPPPPFPHRHGNSGGSVPCGHTPTHILPTSLQFPTHTVTVEALCFVATPQPTSYLPLFPHRHGNSGGFVPCGHTPTHILPTSLQFPTDTVTVKALCFVATPQPTSYLPLSSSPTDTVTVEALCLVATPQPTSYLPPPPPPFPHRHGNSGGSVPRHVLHGHTPTHILPPPPPPPPPHIPPQTR